MIPAIVAAINSIAGESQRIHHATQFNYKNAAKLVR